MKVKITNSDGKSWISKFGSAIILHIVNAEVSEVENKNGTLVVKIDRT